MKNFSVKNINFVGAGAALLAFIFTFIPFYKLQPTTYFLQNESTAALYTITKNLVTYNFIDTLFGMMLFISNLRYDTIGTFFFQQNSRILTGIIRR